MTNFEHFSASIENMAEFMVLRNKCPECPKYDLISETKWACLSDCRSKMVEWLNKNYDEP